MMLKYLLVCEILHLPKVEETLLEREIDFTVFFLSGSQQPHFSYKEKGYQGEINLRVF
jgi:hypothetical protein